jgi:uncharacterized membrane protein
MLRKSDWASVGLTALMLALGVAAFVQVPAGRDVAIHFDGDGVANGWARPAVALFLVPVLAAFNVVMQFALPRIDPRGQNLRRSAQAYGTIWLAVMVVLALAQAIIVATALGVDVAFRGLALGLVGGFFIVVGNVMGKLRWNTTVGIRTPWTIADERVWDQTHRFGGKLFVACGALLVTALFLPVGRDAQAPLIVVATLVPVIGATLKSYVAWRQRTAG